MEPFCKEGDFVLVNKMSYLFFRPKVGHIVVLRDPRDSFRLILKRITAIKDSLLWVEGDNKGRSTDSRDFGWVEQWLILGKALIIGKPPRLKNECGDCARQGKFGSLELSTGHPCLTVV